MQEKFLRQKFWTEMNVLLKKINKEEIKIGGGRNETIKKGKRVYAILHRNFRKNRFPSAKTVGN